MANTALAALLWQKFTMCFDSFVTKALPISYLDSKCHIKKMKSSRTCLTNHTGQLHIMPLVIMPSREGTTHTNTNTFWESNFYKPGVPACGRRVPGLKSSRACLTGY